LLRTQCHFLFSSPAPLAGLRAEPGIELFSKKSPVTFVADDPQAERFLRVPPLPVRGKLRKKQIRTARQTESDLGYYPPSLVFPFSLVRMGNLNEGHLKETIGQTGPAVNRHRSARRRIETGVDGMWLLGQDSNLEPSGYKRPGISSGLGLSLHPLQQTEGGCRALPLSAAQGTSKRSSLCTFPDPSGPTGARLRVTIFRRRRKEGFPEFTRFVNHGFPWKLLCYSHPLCRLSYRGAGGDNLARKGREFKRRPGEYR